MTCITEQHYISIFFRVGCRDRPGRLESTLDFAFEIHNIFGLALKTMVEVTLDNEPKAIPI